MDITKINTKLFNDHTINIPLNINILKYWYENLKAVATKTKKSSTIVSKFSAIKPITIIFGSCPICTYSESDPKSEYYTKRYIENNPDEYIVTIDRATDIGNNDRYDNYEHILMDFNNIEEMQLLSNRFKNKVNKIIFDESVCKFIRWPNNNYIKLLYDMLNYQGTLIFFQESAGGLAGNFNIIGDLPDKIYLPYTNLEQEKVLIINDDIKNDNVINGYNLYKTIQIKNYFDDLNIKNSLSKNIINRSDLIDINIKDYYPGTNISYGIKPNDIRQFKTNYYDKWHDTMKNYTIFNFKKVGFIYDAAIKTDDYFYNNDGTYYQYPSSPSNVMIFHK